MAKVFGVPQQQAMPVMNMPVATPVMMAPAVQPVMMMGAPVQQVMVMQTPALADISMLSGVSKLVIKQKVKLGEAISQGMCEQSNTYEVMDEWGRKLMRAHERSDMGLRCCCAPNHSLRLEINALNPQNPNYEIGTVMTMERVGMCSKWVGCFACTDCCQDGARFHRGLAPGDPGNMSPHTVFATAEQPCLAGGFTPTVQMSSPVGAPFAVVQGPCFFGGCSELCCHSEFKVSKIPPGVKATDVQPVGDHAVLVKKRPDSLGAALREACTDSDVYTLQFKDPNMSIEQKAGTLGTLFLLDYMYFERTSTIAVLRLYGVCALSTQVSPDSHSHFIPHLPYCTGDNDMIDCQDGKLIITFFNCSCFGCVCPCKIESDN